MRSPLRRSFALLLATAAAGCGEQDTTPTPDPDVVLIVDGLTIRLDEVTRYAKIHSTTAPELGHKTIERHLLENYVLPLRLAQREFAARRAELRQQA